MVRRDADGQQGGRPVQSCRSDGGGRAWCKPLPLGRASSSISISTSTTSISSCISISSSAEVAEERIAVGKVPLSNTIILRQGGPYRRGVAAEATAGRPVQRSSSRSDGRAARTEEE